MSRTIQRKKGEEGNAVALTLLGLAVAILAGVVVLYGIGKSNTQPVYTPDASTEKVKVPEKIVNPREGWGVYENEEFGFHIEYPQGWVVATGSLSSDNPVFTLTPGIGTTTATVFDLVDVVPHVSVYPLGISSTTIVASDKTKSSNVIIEVPQASAIDYVLKNGKPWATKAVFEKYPATWSSAGFLFARAIVEEEVLEYWRDEKQIAEVEYDVLKGDIFERSGFLDSKMRETEEEILRSFSFISKEGAVEGASSTNAFLQLETPQENEVVSNPFTVRGVVHSAEYTNNEIYIRLETSSGETLTEIPVTLGEAFLQEQKTFEVSLAFDSTTATSGNVVLGNKTSESMGTAAYSMSVPVTFAE